MESPPLLGPPLELSKPKKLSRPQLRPRAHSSPPSIDALPLPFLDSVLKSDMLQTSKLAEDPASTTQEYIMAALLTLSTIVAPFLLFCEDFFTPEFISKVSRYYNGLEREIYSLACVATHGSVAASLAADIFATARKRRITVEATDADEGWAVAGKGGKALSKRGGSSGKPGGGQDKEKEDGSAGNREGGSEGRGGRGGGGKRGGGPPKPEEEKFFRDVPRVEFFMSVFSTPPHNTPNRVNTSQKIASQLGSNPVIQRYMSQRYNPLEGEGSHKRVLFHGTRQSVLRRFSARGVQPPPRLNTLSSGPAFYTTTDPRTAYLHVLLHHPSVLADDPISLLVFQIKPEVLHGSEPLEALRMECRWFTDDETEDLIEHAEYCLNNEILYNPPENQVDILIAPHLVPGDQFISDSEEVPTQVAAATERAWSYFSETLSEILIEKRMSTTTAENLE
ncbi:hypothetical protein B0H16DRAFT_1589640 [Mycena metata]|uniref:Uncharacterized protein n=1 Tax=Mycena metata TaxID=1033252 RepID=A0AAD7HV01_9AGAR|nr:hypothetical protein B0H16DRAFT_1589640 [Mycena metata]